MFRQQRKSRPLTSPPNRTNQNPRPAESGMMTNEERLLGSPDQTRSNGYSSGDSAVPPGGQQGTAEVQSVGSSLTVTIQRSSESREFGQTDRQTDRQTEGHFCHVCSTACPTQQMFLSHMTGQEHQDRMNQITQLSTSTHIPQQSRGRRPSVQRWCATCQSHFNGDVITHRRTNQHKLCKQSSRPFCPICKRHFRTPRKFVEHMKSPEHKQQVRVEEGQEEELITVDAVGCFEEEEEEEEKDGERRPVAEEEEEGSKADVQQNPNKQDSQGFDHNIYGSRFVVPVSGFLCLLCQQFLYTEDTARHCQTHTHCLHLQKHTAKNRRLRPLSTQSNTDPATSNSLPGHTHPATSNSLPGHTHPATSNSLPGHTHPATSNSLPGHTHPATSNSLPGHTHPATSNSLPGYTHPATSNSLPGHTHPATSNSLPGHTHPATSNSLPGHTHTAT